MRAFSAIIHWKAGEKRLRRFRLFVVVIIIWFYLLLDIFPGRVARLNDGRLMHSRAAAIVGRTHIRPPTVVGARKGIMSLDYSGKLAYMDC